jgi:hypothetical protein
MTSRRNLWRKLLRRLPWHSRSEVKGREVTETLLYILCWIGVVYFIVHVYKMVALTARALFRGRRSGMQEQREDPDPKAETQNLDSFCVDPVRR